MIEVKVRVPAPTQDPATLKGRMLTFEHVPADGQTAELKQLVDVPLSTPAGGIVSAKVTAGNDYWVYLQSTDLANNESSPLNRILVHAEDTTAPNPDAVPEIVSMDDVG